MKRTMTLALLLTAACSGEVKTVYSVQVNQAGKIDWGSETSTLMPAEDETELRQNPIYTGLAYLGSCNGAPLTFISPGEFVLREAGPYTWSECTYVGKGSNKRLVLSFDEPGARYFQSNRSMNNNVKYGQVMAGPGPGETNFRGDAYTECYSDPQPAPLPLRTNQPPGTFVDWAQPGVAPSTLSCVQICNTVVGGNWCQL